MSYVNPVLSVNGSSVTNSFINSSCLQNLVSMLSHEISVTPVQVMGACQLWGSNCLFFLGQQFNFLPEKRASHFEYFLSSQIKSYFCHFVGAAEEGWLRLFPYSVLDFVGRIFVLHIT